ncbi:MAG: cupin [Epsilonproteobacteria bacterium (ex Lamellibrachia satsuma)]|nr:MAG: cupin [Epsilonproteobacteria bacterium (ex Lamellibrachia satsuma)]
MNLFDYSIPEAGETFTTLFEYKNIKINRIVSSDKIVPTEYIQDEDEWVVVLEGRATVSMQNKEIQLTKGDTLFIKAKTPHKVLKTLKDTLWLAIHIF